MANIDDLVNNNSFPEWLTVSDKGNKLVDEIKLAKYLEKKVSLYIQPIYRTRLLVRS